MINIILYQPEKPANTGNILRTAAAARAKVHLIGPLTFEINDHALKRAGMDYLTSVNFYYYENYETFIKTHPHLEIIYITRYGENVYTKKDFSIPGGEFYIMFGSESKGIPHHILRNNLANCYRIPMAMDARSLNLSNAVAIVVYEVLRQQNFRGLAKKEVLKGADFLKNESAD